MEVPTMEPIVENEALPGAFILGDVGPFSISLQSFRDLYGLNEIPDEIMDALFLLKAKCHPECAVLTSQTMTTIMDGDKKACSKYFVRKNILQTCNAVMGPYLEDSNHWTFVHCNFLDNTITYCNSLREKEATKKKIAQNWGTFASSKRPGCGPWKVVLFPHSLQKDNVSCGVFTIMYAECLLNATAYQSQDPAEKRKELAAELWAALDKNTTCGCGDKLKGKGVKCFNCSGHFHSGCLKKDLCVICAQLDPSEKHQTISLQTDSAFPLPLTPALQNIPGTVTLFMSSSEDDDFEEDKAPKSDGSDNEGLSPSPPPKASTLEPTSVLSSAQSDDEPDKKPPAKPKAAPKAKESAAKKPAAATKKIALGKRKSKGDEETVAMGGIYVESLLHVSSSKAAKRHFVSVEELQRRCSAPEKFSANLMVSYLRRAKSQKQEIARNLEEAGVQFAPYASNTTMCTKLVEEDCAALAEDLGDLTKHVPFKAIGKQLAQAEPNVQSALERMDDLSAALEDIQTALKQHMDQYDKVTHTLGPKVTDVTFAMIKECLNAKQEALRQVD